MSRFVLVSDIHGNYPSLQAVVNREGLDAEYIVLGDLMGLMAYPSKVVELIQSLNTTVLLAGNHDKAIFHYGEGHVNDDALSAFELEHTLSELDDEEHEYMSNLPFMEVIQRGGDRICICHSIPWPDKASGYELGNAGIYKRDTTHYASIVSDDYDYVFHGHTHEQYSLDCNQFGHDIHFVNPGSLGYNGTYTVIDTNAGDVTHKNVDINWDEIKNDVAELLPSEAPHPERWL